MCSPQNRDAPSRTPYVHRDVRRQGSAMENPSRSRLRAPTPCPRQRTRRRARLCHHQRRTGSGGIARGSSPAPALPRPIKLCPTSPVWRSSLRVPDAGAGSKPGGSNGFRTGGQPTERLAVRSRARPGPVFWRADHRHHHSIRVRQPGADISSQPERRHLTRRRRRPFV